jgi:hypothetical protein
MSRKDQAMSRLPEIRVVLMPTLPARLAAQARYYGRAMPGPCHGFLD